MILIEFITALLGLACAIGFGLLALAGPHQALDAMNGSDRITGLLKTAAAIALLLLAVWLFGVTDSLR